MPDPRAAPLRILHWPTDVGGHPSGLARAERALGLHSDVAVITRSPFNYDVDIDLNLAARSRLRRLAGRTSMLLRAARDYDIVHLNFAQPFLPLMAGFGIDLPLLKASGVRIFTTCQGCDVRIPARCAVCATGSGPCSINDGPRRADVARYIARWSERVFCLNPDLTDLVPDSLFMPYASIDPLTITPVFAKASDRPLRIVHAPTDRNVKGTSAVIDAIAALGSRVEFDLIEHLPRDQAMLRYAQADIIIDQLRLGWYGGLSVEAMALGKIVISRIDPTLATRVPLAMQQELPVISAAESDISCTLDRIFSMTESQRHDLAVRSRRFVERWHNPRALASWMHRHYQSHAQGPSASRAFDPDAIASEA